MNISTGLIICCISLVQSLSHIRLFATPWTAARQDSPSITNCWSPPKPMSIELVMPSNHLILCRPLLLLPSIFPSIRVFSNESALRIRWPKYWNFSFNISPSNEHLGLISFRMDWLDLLAVQGTLKSLLQHHSSKASILWCSAFFIVQFSHPILNKWQELLTVSIFRSPEHGASQNEWGGRNVWGSGSPMTHRAPEILPTSLCHFVPTTYVFDMVMPSVLQFLPWAGCPQ